jgi:hypothetical protein
MKDFRHILNSSSFCSNGHLYEGGGWIMVPVDAGKIIACWKKMHAMQICFE